MPEAANKMTALKQIERIKARRDRRHQADSEQLRELIRLAREQGATWPQVAEAMGLTREGAIYFSRGDPKAGR